jgi:hypothetical protein
MTREEFIEKIKVLEVQDGDIILLKTRQKLSNLQKEHLIQESSRIFPRNQVVVLEDGLDIAVLRKEYVDGDTDKG